MGKTMNNTMKYKSYTAIVEFSAEDECLVGHIAGINDLIGFHADSVEEIRQVFHETVDVASAPGTARPACRSGRSQRQQPEQLAGDCAA